MKRVPVISLSLTFLVLGQGILAQTPERQLLGIRLRITEEKAHERLKTLGTLIRKEEPRQEVWQIHDASFSHLIVGFNKDNQLRYVTAVARTDNDAKKLTYESVGDLKRARQAGDSKINNFNYQWELPANGNDPSTLVMAIGRDPKFLSSCSLKSLEDKAGEAEND